MEESKEFGDITKDQYDEFCEAWSFFDPDGKGFILTKDFGTVLRCLNITVAEEEKISLLCEYDPDNTGEISFNTFLTIIVKKSQPTTEDEEVLASLKLFDTDKKQCLSVDKFKTQLNKFPDEINKQEIEFLCDKIKLEDDNGEDYINLDHAVSIILKETLQEGFFVNGEFKI